MLKTNYNKDEIITLIKDTTYLNVDVQEYAIGDSRSSYFDSNSAIYEQMMNDIDNLEFLIDKVSVIRDNYDYNHESTLSDIFDVINNYSLEDIEDYETIRDDLKLGELKILYPSIYKSVVEILDNLTDEDLDVYSDGGAIFDCTWIEESINNSTYEALAYWTVYFEPDYEDEEVALKVGLVPFKYKDTFYLALGGCGMDLSPKLDAYVALTYSRIPKNSRFFDDMDYFKYVVGETIYNEIIKKCKLSKTQFVLSFTH